MESEMKCSCLLLQTASNDREIKGTLISSLVLIYSMVKVEVNQFYQAGLSSGQSWELCEQQAVISIVPAQQNRKKKNKGQLCTTDLLNYNFNSSSYL